MEIEIINFYEFKASGIDFNEIKACRIDLLVFKANGIGNN